LFRRRKSNRSFLIVAAAVLLLDQISKHYIAAHFLPGESRLVVPRLLRWTYERNVHGAFGLFGSSPVLLVLMALAVLLVFWFSFRDAARQSALVRVAFGLILGGAVGNIADRLQHRYVIDFIDFYKIWPNIFNVADSSITVGVVFLLLSSLATRRHR